MSFLRRHSRIALAATCCVALGAGASAIASAGAAPGHSAPRAHRHGAKKHGHGLRSLARRAVHADLVVATKQGFVNVTVDRGKVDAVSGQQLTLTEGTKKQTYKTLTLTIPSTAKVRDDRQPASLSALRSGQRVIVVTAPQRTLVIARTARGG
ncbi:MAG: hypothetical protein ACR2GZ_08190 [Solirubrobacteraceae bacterium]